MIIVVCQTIAAGLELIRITDEEKWFFLACLSQQRSAKGSLPGSCQCKPAPPPHLTPAETFTLCKCVLGLVTVHFSVWNMTLVCPKRGKRRGQWQFFPQIQVLASKASDENIITHGSQTEYVDCLHIQSIIWKVKKYSCYFSGSIFGRIHFFIGDNLTFILIFSFSSIIWSITCQKSLKRPMTIP